MALTGYACKTARGGYASLDLPVDRPRRGSPAGLQYDAAMVELILISVIGGAVVSLLVAARARDRDLEITSKTFASATVLVLGVTRWSPGEPVGMWIVVGLALCAVGDVLLLWRRSFDAGVGTFLAGHLAYTAAFEAALPITEWPILLAGPIALSSLGALSWLWPRLGRRRPAIVAYVAVITVMVWGAVATAASRSLGWTAALGAGLFYLSDLAVARHRFGHAEFLNRAVGLPLYYSGQILLAITIGS